MALQTWLSRALMVASISASALLSARAADDPAAAGQLPAPQGPSEGTAVINYDQVQQVVDGFGFSTAWGSVPGDANDDAFFSVTRGAGFSIVRNRIPFRERPEVDDKFMAKDEKGAYKFTVVNDSQGSYKKFELQWDNWDLAKTKALLDKVKGNADYQVTKVFSTPWTPPNNPVDRWKNVTDASSKAKNRLTEQNYAKVPDMGGSLKPEHYQDYADVLADYVLGFKPNMGFELYALSIQNEPNFDCNYESCDWTAEQLHDFLLVLNQEFKRKGVWSACPNLKILAPEHNNFHDKLLSAVYADPITRDLVGIAAGHQYEFGPWSMSNNLANLFTPANRYTPNKFDASRKLGKPVWMTEWSMSAFRTTPMNQALALAKTMHQDFANSGLNAFVFWWSRSLLEQDKPTKNLWALAQYSRFARPGWHRLNATPSPVAGVYLTAFADTAGKKASVVAVNTSTEAKTITLELSGASQWDAMALYRTSASEDMAAVGSAKVNGRSHVVTLAPSSISTFYAGVTP